LASGSPRTAPAARASTACARSSRARKSRRSAKSCAAPCPGSTRSSDLSEGGVSKGEGYAVAQLDDLGEGPGFRKIRKELGVTAFGVNAIVLPPSYATGSHYHDEQEELYFLHAGRVEIEFGDGSTHELLPGGLAWVDALTPRRLRN